MWYNGTSNSGLYVGGRLIPWKGGDANGNVSSSSINGPIRDVYSGASDVYPKDEIDRPPRKG